MANYSKAIAAILSGAVTIGAAYGLPELSPSMIAGLATVLSGVFVYFAPANQPQ